MLIYVVSHENFNLSCHDPFHILSFSVESFLLYRNNPPGGGGVYFLVTDSCGCILIGLHFR